jgi:hypothetical protein|nr:MAG TPA: repressor [Caudoviricetes sp.]
MTKKTKRFALENSDAIDENERILEAGSQQRRENRENKDEKAEQEPVSGKDKPTTDTQAPSTPVAEQSAPTYSSDIMQNARKLKGKKTENGIVVNVPMEDYMQLTMMKFQSGRTLKDLALQAIHEFVERNK